ncbi:MAG TPA: GNAT family N-acetyltransferase [Acidimicrobiales bacterium]|nr:GNAT family N-acetyltransferase [Acidimicrobiales bacterium]
MDLTVEATDDANEVVEKADAFLASDPVMHNLVRTLLAARVAAPEPGRYWMVRAGDDVVGVVFLSPLDFAATMTPMPAEAVAAVVTAIADSGVRLPGIHGDAATAARFAGQWTEMVGVGAFPTSGMRVYELHTVVLPSVEGRLRVATPAEHDLLVEWVTAFQVEVGDGPTLDIEALVARRTAAGEMWVWDTGEAVSIAAASTPLDGVSRIAFVYTPPERRGTGYASGCVAALSQRLLDEGHRPMLYTDLGNPVSNSIYRRMGYRAAGECLRYRFG